MPDSGFVEPDTRDLVAFDRWSILPNEADPFPTHRTSQHSCDPDGVLPEEEVLEINTGDCGYAIVGQSLLTAVSSGDTVDLLVYHSALSSTDENAKAHFSLVVADHIFWDIEIDIPWQSEVYIVSKTIDWSAPKGALVRVHLHNHGGNSWRVGYLRRAP